MALASPIWGEPGTTTRFRVTASGDKEAAASSVVDTSRTATETRIFSRNHIENRVLTTPEYTKGTPTTSFVSGSIQATASSRPTFVRPEFDRLDKPSTLSRLDRLRDLPTDWNGYGASPINLELIEQARDLVEQLPGDIIDPPAVVPMTRGRLQLEWHRGNRSLELEFESPGRIHYLKADDDSGVEEEDILLNDQAPEIQELLRWFSSE